MQTGFGPVTRATGLPLTVIGLVGSDTHPVFVVNINRAEPLDNPVTIPFVVTEATVG
jgi:hypothetical protein